MAIPRVPGKRLNAVYLLVAFPLAATVLLVGGVLGLPLVATDRWGGLFVTLVVAVFGIVVSLPLGVLLALARRSRLPLVRWLAVALLVFAATLFFVRDVRAQLNAIVVARPPKLVPPATEEHRLGDLHL